MKMKLSLIAFALVATAGITAAQNTPVKTKDAKVEKSCCTEASQKATADKKDVKTCKCEGVKEVNGKVEKNKECTGTCDKKDQKSVTCCDKKVEKKAACCEGAKAAEVKPATENCSECEKAATVPTKATKK